MQPNPTRVYHFLKAEHALSNLERRRIKISVFDDVNDKRELLAYRVQGFDGAKVLATARPPPFR